MNSDSTAALPPSGSWTGYYFYVQAAAQHQMSLILMFTRDGKIQGDGVDDISFFTIDGSFDMETREATWKKAYVKSHSVEYRGVYHQRKITGTWTLAGADGGFCIWPDSRAAKETSGAEMEQPEDLVVVHS